MLEPTEEPLEGIIFYRALVKVVELYVDGRMMQGDASALSKGGWSFKVDEGERVRAIAAAVVLENQLAAEPRTCLAESQSPEESLSVLLDGRDRRHHWEQALRPRSEATKLRLMQDEVVFNIARPEDLMNQSQPAPGKSGGRSAPSASSPGKSELNGEPAVPQVKGGANSFTYGQKKKMQHRERDQPKEATLIPESLDPAYADKHSGP